jgi:dolichyl-diphosphooligosaccharide--protein glycosyltransferase
MIAQGMPSPKMEASLLYRLHSNGIVPGVEVDKNRFKEVYKSKYGKVRIYKIMSVSLESKEWVKNNLVCDAPGSWFCKGQYPPGLQKVSIDSINYLFITSPNHVSIHTDNHTHYASTKVLAEKKDFRQLEDFNSKTEADDTYQRQYFEHLSDPEKAKRRAEVRARKQRQAAEAGEQQPAALTNDQIKDINKKWQDSEVTSRLFNIIQMGDYDSFEFVLENNPSYAHVRSKDGRGPMWWAHEHGRPKMISLLKSLGVSEKRKDKDGITPLDISDDEL